MRNFITIFVFGVACWVYAGEDVRLPPSVFMVSDIVETGGWQVTGTISGAQLVAVGDFALCLNSQGWRRESGTVMSRGRRESGLTVWIKGNRRMLLMLWGSSAGKSKFALGEYKQNNKNKKGVGPLL